MLMRIPKPAAKYGDRVNVENYRFRPARWERGRVCGLRYANEFGPMFNWSYDVVLDRPGPRGPIRLYVGDRGISRVTVREEPQ